MLVKGGIAIASVGLLGVWGAGEFLISRANPPLQYTGVILTPEADPVLRRACFDCHSNETRYPAYSYLPIASLLLANHVQEGREAGNFSEWGEMTPEDRRDSIEETLEEIQKDRMPLNNYLWLHPEAQLSTADRALLQEAARTVYGVTGESEKAGKKAKGERAEKEVKEGKERH